MMYALFFCIYCINMDFESVNKRFISLHIAITYFLATFDNLDTKVVIAL